MVADSDYQPVTATTLAFAAGETSKQFTVQVNGDTTVESDETFTVELSNASGATIGDGSGLGTIGNDDGGGPPPTPSLSIGDASVAEGGLGAVTPLVFTVRLSAASAGPVTVDFATQNGNAIAPMDYTAVSATTLTFNPGETSKQVTVLVTGDADVEPDETFTVNLSNASGATIAGGQATGTIVNDDGAPPNDAAPSVPSTSPASGATHVATDANVVVTFSESVSATASSFTLECPGGSAQAFAVSGSPGTAVTLDPTGSLPEGAVCSVTVLADQVSDSDAVDPPDHMAANFVFSFTVDGAPSVTTTNPATGATGVDPTTNVTVTFSEPVSASVGSFTLECPSGSAQLFSVSGSGTSTITLNPTADLPASTACTVTVLATGISDVDTGDPPDHPAANTTFSFTTADAAPSVTTTSPADGADDVAVNTNVVVNFSESVTVGGSSFVLECPTGLSQSFAVSGSPGSSIMLNPTADLPEGTTCTVTAVAANISDTDAVDPPDHPAANISFSFTTDSAPAVTSHLPADGATDVAANTNISFNFSEPVTVDSSSFTISCNGNPQTFQVSGSGTSSITLDPDSDLPTANCTVTAVAANISDVDAGDPPDHPVANTSFSFSTQDAAPTVTTTSPADAADHVAVNTNVVVNFSEPVTATTSSFTLDCPAGTPQGFTISGSPGSSITLDPSSNLPEGTICSVTVIANQISDVDSVDPPDHPAANISFSFTTDSAPAVTTTTPADNATDVDPSANITVNFNEAVDVTTSSFTISCNSNPQSFSMSGSGTSSITLDPDSDLPSTASCTVTAVAANISDTDTGDPPDHPAANHSFSFTTQDAAPSVTTTSPADGATDVARDTTIVVTFSESVSAMNNTFTIECPTGTAMSFSQSSSPATTITLTPSANLPAGKICTVKVAKDEISDADAVDPPDHMAADYTFSFTTKANSAPSDIQLSSSSIAENQPSGTDVGTLTTTDPDAGDTHTYSLQSTGCGGGPFPDNSSFQIGGAGNDKLQSAASFNFEVKNSYTLCLRSTDSGSLFFDRQFTISVTNVNEPPSDISLSNNSIDENKASGSAVGNLSQVGDPDSGETYTFTLLTSGCSGSFPDSSSFQVFGSQLQSAVSFNFEADNSYTICVRVNDPGSPNLSFERQFTISINDVNDPPVDGNESTNGVGNTLLEYGSVPSPSSAAKRVVSGNLLSNATDEDSPPQTLTISAPGSTSSQGGTVSLSSGGAFSYVPAAGFTGADSFNYTVSDGHGGTDTSTVTITVASRVWYVKNNATAGGSGRSTDPFDTLAEADTAANATGDITYVYKGDGTTNGLTGGFSLLTSQKLLGEPVNLVVGADTLATGTPANRPSLSGTVALASGSRVEGVDIAGSGGAAIAGTNTGGSDVANVNLSGGAGGVALTGAASGTFTFTNVTVNTTGGTGFLVNSSASPTINVGSAGTESVSATGGTGVSISIINSSSSIAFDSVSASGGAYGINFASTGAVGAAFGSGSLSGSTADFRVNGGSGTVSYSGTLADGSGLSADIQNRSGGSITLSGNINDGSDAGGGINMALNTGGSTTFSGTAKTLNTGASGAFVSTGSGHTITFSNGGLDIDTTTGAGFSATGGGTVNVTGATNTLTTTTGTALTLNGVGGAIDLTDLDKNGGGTGISLTGVSASVTIPSGATIANTTTAGVTIDQGTGAFSYAGTISNSSGRPVQVTNRNTGSPGLVQFTGSITSTGGTGVNLDNNDNGTITFAGGLVISTGTNTAFAATNGGTVNVDNTSVVNTLTTTTGTALNVQNTTIGATGLKFQSISANGGTNGIVLNNTGNTAGLTVTGTGITAGSGGTIQNITSRGASFIDTRDITLKNMNFNDVGTADGADPTVDGSGCGALDVGNNLSCSAGIHLVNVTNVTLDRLALNNDSGGNSAGQEGINGNNVTNLTLSNSSVLNFGNAVKENGLRFLNLLGTVSISGTTISGNEETQAWIQNTTGTVTVTVSASSFSTSSAPNGGHGIGFYGSGSATMNLDVQSGTQFTNIRSIGVQAHGLGNAQMTVKVNGSTFTNTGSAGIDIATKDSADTKFNVTSNTMTGQGATAINVDLGGAPTGTQNATLQGNVSGNNLSPVSGAPGISLDANAGQVGQGGSVTATVTNNQISIGAGSANSINALTGDGAPTLNATITNNTVTTSGGATGGDFFLESAKITTDTSTACMEISGNNIPNNTGSEILISQRFGSTFRVRNFTGSTTINAFLASQNTLNGGTVLAEGTYSNTIPAGSQCPQPVLP
jgi:methionine-rich copper-binding protein CopC